MQCKWCAQVLDKKTKALAKLKHLEGGRGCVSGRLVCCRLLAIRLPRVTCTGLKFASVEQSINVINYVIMNLTLRIKTKQLGCESTSGKGCEKCLYLGNNKKTEEWHFPSALSWKLCAKSGRTPIPLLSVFFRIWTSYIFLIGPHTRTDFCFG